MKLILIIILAFGVFMVGCENSTENKAVTASPAVTAPAIPTASFPKEEAEKLIQRLATQDGCRDSTADMRLSFTDAEGKPQQMDFRLQRKYDAGKISTLMTVLAPKEESEKALLAFEEEGKPTDAISYLAGLKKTAHLKSDNPLNLRGSKSTVQETLGLELRQYEITSTELDIPERNEITIHLKEKKGMNLAYPTLNIIFRKSPISESAKAPTESIERSKEYFPALFILLDSKDQTIKKMEIMAIDFVEAAGKGRKYDAIKSIEIADDKSNQKLKLETRSIKFDTNIPSSIFTEAHLIKTVTAATAKLVQ